MMARSRLDAARLAAAYERDARRLLVFFTRRTYDAQLAVDLVGETYARAFELRRRFAADADDAGAVAAWVFGIGRNVLNEELRRGALERRALRRAGVQTPVLAGLLRLRRRARRRRVPVGAGGWGRGAVRHRLGARGHRRRQPAEPRRAARPDVLRSRRGPDLGVRRAAGRGAQRRGGRDRRAHDRPRCARRPEGRRPGRPSAGMRVFVAALDGAREVPLVTARDVSGAVLLVCRDGRCTTPTTEGSP